MAKRVSIMVWGATGITGRKVCRELALRYTGTVTWGMAGRSFSKLETLANEMVALNEKCADVQLAIARLDNKKSVETMVRQAEIIIACAGPFRKYSDMIVETCVKEGTHYVDVTGDIVWVRSLIDRFHEEATKNKTKIVPLCGMESVPADIGCFFMSDYVRKRYGRGVSRILCGMNMKIHQIKPASRGTIDSLLDEVEFTPEEKKIRVDPQALTPPDKRVANVWEDEYRIRYEEDFGLWTGPWITQTVDTRVVRRTNALLDVPYGKDFDCTVRACSKSYITCWFDSILARATNCLIASPCLISTMHCLGIVPKPGQGPSIESEKKDSWKATFYAIVEPEEGASTSKPIIAKGSMSDNHGIYTSTARQVVECAMCQALEGDRLKQLGMVDGGVITPASAFGNVLVDRLSAIGIKIQNEEAE